MTIQTRDTLALYAIAAFAVVLTLYGDLNIFGLFEAILDRP
jgi:hypothetical protein